MRFWRLRRISRSSMRRERYMLRNAPMSCSRPSPWVVEDWAWAPVSEASVVAMLIPIKCTQAGGGEAGWHPAADFQSAWTGVAHVKRPAHMAPDNRPQVG